MSANPGNLAVLERLEEELAGLRAARRRAAERRRFRRALDDEAVVEQRRERMASGRIDEPTEQDGTEAKSVLPSDRGYTLNAAFAAFLVLYLSEDLG